MNNVSKEIFNIELKILTPTHIGSGDSIPKTEFGFFPGNELVRKVDFNKYFESLAPFKIKKTSEKLRHARNDFFNNILQGDGISIENLDAEYDLNFYYSYNIEDLNKIREIKSHIKTPNFKPYIPGSSVKGWLRNAILYYYVKRLREAKKFVEEFYERLDRLPTNKKQLKKERGKMGEILENNIFGADPREDIFRFFIISDTQPIAPDNLNLALVQIFHPVEYRGSIEFQSLQFSQYLEVLKDNSTLSGKIVISREVENYRKEYMQSKSHPTKIRNHILNELVDQSRDYIFEKIAEISNIASKRILKCNRSYLHKLNGEIHSSEIQRMIDYYDNNLFPLHDEISGSNDQFLMRLGAGTEWHSKTVGLALFDYVLKNKSTDFNSFYDRINRLQIFKGQKMQKYFQLAPISRAYMVDSIKAPQHPLGWVKVQLKS